MAGETGNDEKDWKVGKETGFYGYPHIADEAPVFDPDKIQPIWDITEGVFGGYPHPRTAEPQEFNPDKIYPIWVIDPSEFYGYPHPGKPIKREAVSLEWTADPLIVYPQDEQKFLNNGLAILSPIQAEYEIQKNEAGSIHVVHPIDPYGDWKTLKLGNIILAPVTIRGEPRPQPFRIYRVIKSRTGNEPTITVEALHVFYDLNYDLAVHPVNGNCDQCIQTLLKDTAVQWKTGQGNFELSDEVGSFGGKCACENFTGSSDMKDPDSEEEIPEDKEAEVKYLSYPWYTLTNCLVGDENSIANAFGGSLFVDKFRFSINKRRETSLENCFNLEYGVDMLDITETVDNTNVFSRVMAKNTADGSMDFQYASYIDDFGFPYHKTLYAEFTCDSGQQDFQDMVSDFCKTCLELDVSYQASLADLPNTEQYKDWKALATHEIGDTGHIYDMELGIDTVQEITGKKVDLLTGQTLSINLGNIQRTLANTGRFANAVSTGQKSLAQKQAERAMSQGLRYWSQLEVNYTWQELEQFTWGDCGR